MLVYDKNVFGSEREIDPVNGYLRVGSSNITRTQVAGYLGKEIPNYKEFELEPDKIYYVLRPEAELKKAVETFNNLPLTRKHIEIDVDNVPKEDIVGSLGDSAVYEDGFIKNSLIVYDQKYIDRIQNGKQKELSCGYRYTPVRQSGEFEGQHYDFVMTDIVGNHVALVKEGRAGHDVVVSDSIEALKESIMNLFKKKELAEDEFVESEHPRAKNGQFTNKGGESSGSERKSDEIDSIYYSALRKGPDDRTRNDFIRGRYNDIKDLEKRYESEKDPKEKEEKKADLEFAKKRFKEMYGESKKEESSKETTNDKAIPDEQDKPETAGEEKADVKEEKMDKEEKKESVAEVKKEEVVDDKAVDKRKLIDEIGGILKGKVDDELIRTIIKKAEEIAYNGSEAGKADDEVKKEEIVKDKCAKDECKDKMAKDEMTFDVDSIKAQVREEVMQDFKARDEARKNVKSTLGEINVMAFDSCADIYKMACEKAGLNVSDIANYKDAFIGFTAGSKANKAVLALDASPKSGSNVEECLKKNIRV